MITSVTQVVVEDGGGRRVWRVTAASDAVDPNFYWYVEGVLVGSGSQPWRQFTVAPGAGLQVEVFDSSSDVPLPGYPSDIELQWEHVPGATAYLIQKTSDPDGGGYEDWARVPANGQFYSWRSPALGIGRWEFRVVGLFGLDIQGASKDYVFDVAPRPGAPVVSVVMAGGVVTGSCV